MNRLIWFLLMVSFMISPISVFGQMVNSNPTPGTLSVDAGDTYSNFSTSADDDTIDELMAAIDSAFGLRMLTTSVLNEDNFATESNTYPPTQDSVAKYIASDPNQITESITADENPETITPTATWTGGKIFIFKVNETSGDGHAIALSETGPPANGTIAVIRNVSAANTLTIPDSDGSLEIPNGGTITLEPDESYVVIYDTDRWFPYSDRSNVSFATFTTTETEFVPIGWTDITDGGADPPESLYSTDSNSREIKIATFDGATDEDRSFIWDVPEDITGSTIKVRWLGIVTNATGPSNEAISFQVSCISVADGEQLDFAAYGDAVSITESAVTEAQDDIIISAYSSAITPTGLAGGETVHCLINRDADGNDTYAQDFGLYGVRVKYQRTHDTTF